MIIVQLFATDQDAPWRYIGRGIRRLKVAITPEVADAVDHTCRKKGNPNHLARPKRNAGDAEQNRIDDQQQRHPKKIMASV